MTDKTHQVIGITAATAAVLYLQPDQTITVPVILTVLFGSMLGSITPDIDQPTSDFWDRVPLGGIVGRFTSRCLGGHRNLSHSLLGIVLFYFLMQSLVALVPNNWHINIPLLFNTAMIGFIAHLIADALTVRGIPIFWPLGRDMGFPPYPLDGMRIITGKWFENLVIFPGVSLILLYLVILHANRFHL